MQLTMYIADMLNKTVLTAGVTNDSVLPDDIKNIIIEFKPNEVNFIGTSPFITLKNRVANDTYTLEQNDEIDFFCIRAKEIIGLLASFKNREGTVTLENINNQIRCTVFAQGDSYGTIWHFDNLPINMATKRQISSVNLSSSLYPCNVDELSNYLKIAHPILLKDNSLYSYLTFGNNHIITYNQFFTLVQEKQLIPNEVFSNIRLYHKYINFLIKNLLPIANENILVGKTDRFIIFNMPEFNIECYIIYDSKVMAYQNYLDMFTKQHFITINKDYLLTCIKRATLLKDSNITIIISLAKNCVEISNPKGVQAIPLLNICNFNSYPTLSFEISPKIILGAIPKNIKDENLNLYYCPTNDNDLIVLTDTENKWFSMLRVKLL